MVELLVNLCEFENIFEIINIFYDYIQFYDYINLKMFSYKIEKGLIKRENINLNK